MPAVEIAPENKIQVARWRIKYRDIFDLKKFYMDLHDWLEEFEWADLEDESDHYENLYLEKIDMQGMKEQWIRWRPQKVPQGNPYYRYWFDFDYHNVGILPTEVVRDGKKFKVNKGEIELFVTAFLELDWQRQWAAHGILKYFRKLFVQRIFRKDLAAHKRELYREAYELQTWMKQWFKLKRYHPYEEKKPFQPSYAWPSHVREK